jgi:hypothetical protein
MGSTFSRIVEEQLKMDEIVAQPDGSKYINRNKKKNGILMSVFTLWSSGL